MTVDPESPQRLRAAFVRRVHGVHGEVRADAIGGDWQRFRRGLVLHTEAGDRVLKVRSARDGGEATVLIAFDGVDTPEAARELCGTYLTVELGAARTLAEDEWFVWQLQGLSVVADDGAQLGTVDDVESGVANDVLVIRSAQGVRRLPMVRSVVHAVDVERRLVTVAAIAEDDA
ncbi:MAG TPA: ribosome maturation factor RimM [Dehalococcoidia bacterium]|nr:ribosome maturation factor RimM [Dehalococcoidia bacterium]